MQNFTLQEVLLDKSSLEEMNGEQLSAVTDSLVNKAIGIALLVIFKATTVSNVFCWLYDLFSITIRIIHYYSLKISKSASIKVH